MTREKKRRFRLLKVLFAVVVLFFVIVCAGLLSSEDFGEESASKSEAEEPAPVAERPAPTRERQPKLIPYEIIERKVVFPHTGARLEIRVDLVDGKLPTKQQLGAVSKYLVSQETEKRGGVFVAFLLPGMKSGEGCFATAHHNPDMKVVYMWHEILTNDRYKYLAPD